MDLHLKHFMFRVLNPNTPYHFKYYSNLYLLVEVLLSGSFLLRFMDNELALIYFPFDRIVLFLQLSQYVSFLDGSLHTRLQHLGHHLPYPSLKREPIRVMVKYIIYFYIRGIKRRGSYLFRGYQGRIGGSLGRGIG